MKINSVWIKPMFKVFFICYDNSGDLEEGSNDPHPPLGPSSSFSIHFAGKSDQKIGLRLGARLATSVDGFVFQYRIFPGKNLPRSSPNYLIGRCSQIQLHTPGGVFTKVMNSLVAPYS